MLLFRELIVKANTSAELLGLIRDSPRSADQRMSLLKLFRRCVSLACDTESTKKVKTVPTSSIIQNLGHTFKGISKLKSQFCTIRDSEIIALCALLGENDDRGQLGYALTGKLFDWFEEKFKGVFTIEGPRGAGRDIELSSVVPEFNEQCPCDFIIRTANDKNVVSIGFARYDSSRGGSQSDDRTGGNANKVEKMMRFSQECGKTIKIIFLADGPGLVHKDTWAEACKLDGSWNDRVRVSTLKLADTRVTCDWLRS